jgi:ABC-type sugar transport system permease subunit
VTSIAAARRPKGRLEPYLWVLPAVALFFGFVHLPMLVEIGLSFLSSSGLEEPKFVGVQHYVDLASDAAFWSAIRHNLLFALLTVTAKVTLALALAVALNQALRGRNFFRTVFFLPFVLSYVAVGIIWTLIYNYDYGVLNHLLRRVGADGLVNDWLGNPDAAFGAVVAVAIWKHVGFHMVVYLAGLQSIPQELYEAAAIDGARRWHRFRHITLPLLARYTAINVMIATLWAFSVFDLVYVMTQGGPVKATDVAMIQVYQQAFFYSRLGYAASQSVVMLAIVGFITIAIMTWMRRREVEA